MQYEVAHIAADTRALLHQTHDDHIVHSECVVGRKQIDNDHEDHLFTYLERFNVLSSAESNKQWYPGITLEC